MSFGCCSGVCSKLIWWFSVLLQTATSGAFLASVRVGGPRPFRLISLRAHNLETVALTIPIFPLRKTVRLPTEQLTLNLYEERYLQMAESILKKNPENQLFGALYSADKPQIVKGGIGPIVPLIESGDSGVLCLVEASEEGMIPTRGAEPRRRIRLIATGILPFHVESVVQRGVGFNTSISESPYIVARVTIKFDAINTANNTKVQHVTANGHEVHQDDHILLSETAQQYGTSTWNTSKSLDQLAQTVSKNIIRGSYYDHILHSLQSFALVSALLRDSWIEDRLRALSSNSVKDRLETLRETKRWWQW